MSTAHYITGLWSSPMTPLKLSDQRPPLAASPRPTVPTNNGGREYATPIRTPLLSPNQGREATRGAAGDTEGGSRETGEAKRRQWALGDFDIGPKLGEGRFGKIYLAREKTTHCAVVIKCINKDAIIRLDMVHQLQREVELQRYASSGVGGKYVVRLYAYFWDMYTVYLVLEYCEGGDLQALLKAHGRLAESTVAACARDLLRALNHLHERGILHRDIKPDNVLLRKGRCKLADFTWAVQCDRTERRQTLCGTLDYLSPEIVTGVPYAAAADMWSLGALLFELLSGSPPFDHPQARETCAAIQSGVPPELPSTLSSDAVHFVMSLLQTQPERRLTAAAALQHRWIVAVGETSSDHAIGRSNSRDPFPRSASAMRSSLGSLSQPERQPLSRGPDHAQSNSLQHSSALDDVSAATASLKPSRLMVEDVSRALDLNPVTTDPPSNSSVGISGALGSTATPLSSNGDGNVSAMTHGPAAVDASAIAPASQLPSMMHPPRDSSSSAESSDLDEGIDGVSAIGLDVTPERDRDNAFR